MSVELLYKYSKFKYIRIKDIHEKWVHGVAPCQVLITNSGGSPVFFKGLLLFCSFSLVLHHCRLHQLHYRHLSGEPGSDLCMYWADSYGLCRHGARYFLLLVATDSEYTPQKNSHGPVVVWYHFGNNGLLRTKLLRHKRLLCYPVGMKFFLRTNILNPKIVPFYHLASKFLLKWYIFRHHNGRVRVEDELGKFVGDKNASTFGFTVQNNEGWRRWNIHRRRWNIYICVDEYPRCERRQIRSYLI